MELSQVTSDKRQVTTGATDGGLRLADFDYILPEERIAQQPLKRRDDSKLLILHRESGRIEHCVFRDLPDYLKPKDALVLNETKVIPARIFGQRATGGRVEAFLLRRLDSQTYEALLNPSSKLMPGSRILFEKGMEAQIVGGNGTVKTIRFKENHVERRLRQKGLPPLPPYIRRTATRKDLTRYQTVYARREGAVAAPTAGLHFTKGLLQKIRRKGVRICPATLHVGYGTFEPVREEQLAKHNMHEEYFEINKRACRILNETRQRGGRVVAVGTTSCRVLEASAVPASPAGGLRKAKGERPQIFYPRKEWTNLFIYPPYEFRGTEALITNFHLPKSTLLMLVSAFAGIELIRKAYREAIEKDYRFYSYGDAMLIL